MISKVFARWRTLCTANIHVMLLLEPLRSPDGASCNQQHYCNEISKINKKLPTGNVNVHKWEIYQVYSSKVLRVSRYTYITEKSAGVVLGQLVGQEKAFLPLQPPEGAG